MSLTQITFAYLSLAFALFSIFQLRWINSLSDDQKAKLKAQHPRLLKPKSWSANFLFLQIIPLLLMILELTPISKLLPKESESMYSSMLFLFIVSVMSIASRIESENILRRN